MSNEKFYTNGNLYSIVTFAFIVRCSVSLHPYSGQNVPPMFGDYEAQRHWMELTVNLPPDEWYFNSSRNDLLYWGLDYPPLTAYHSYLNGKIAKFINPDFVKLYTSRGYESYDHKFFMRMTVVVADILYFVAVTLFFNSVYKINQHSYEIKHKETQTSKKLSSLKNLKTNVSFLVQIAISLLYPGLILIDHGHFQYNSVSLGFTVAAVAALIYDRLYMSSFLFCLALNYKQMSLYHSLPFFVYMLSHCYPTKKPNSFISGLTRLTVISLTVILTFGIVWYPFLTEKNMVQVVKRLFPLSRGIFEDKVSNIWCAVNVIYKLNKAFNQFQMAKICTACVLCTSLPSLIKLFKCPSLLQFLLSLINVSLNFFLFSYQVHEKSILLVALPVLLFFPFGPFPCFWFLTISNFSMLPLFQKDKLLIPFVALNLLFTLFVFANIDFQSDQKLSKNKGNKLGILVNYAFKLSLLGCVALFLCSLLINPPAKYPDLWPLLSSVYSCFHFCLFGLYFNYIQMFKTLE